MSGFTPALTAKLLWRNWRSGELRILAGAVVLAVAVVTAIAVFANRMERSIERQSHSYMAADLQVVSRFAIPEDWSSLVSNQYELQQAKTVEFASMVFAGQDMSIASVKAVSPGYPLRGQLDVSDIVFAVGDQVVMADGVPKVGEVWVESRLLPMMGLALGDVIQLGEASFKIAKVIIHEPDGNQGFSMTGPRVLMNLEDLASTQVIQPGSRVTYRWLIAGEDRPLTEFTSWIEPQLGEHYRLVTLGQSQQNVGQALQRGRSFLMIAGMVGVLLAGVAIAIAAQQFARNNQDTVALVKSLGATGSEVRLIYLGQFLLLALVATAVGLLSGELLHLAIAGSVSSLFNVELVGSTWQPYATGFATGVVCLLGFALPPIWPLPKLSPMRILRSDIELNQIGLWQQGSIGLLAIIALIGFYSQDIKLTVAFVVGITVVVVFVGLFAFLMLRGSRQLGSRAGSIWRLALANLVRNGRHSVVQLVVFSTAIMLLLALFLVRTSLIEQWRMQLPEDAPNHFILNMAEHESEAIADQFAAKGYPINPLYPMILGRLVATNDHHYGEQDRHLSNTVRRELNLSWTKDLPDNNEIIQGQWWDSWEEQGFGVSVEQSTAEELGLGLGDRLTFSLGGLSLEARVASIRTVEWDSLSPNFYFLFSPGALDGYSPTYMTSSFIPSDDKVFINQLISQYPTVLVIEVDRIIDRIQGIIAQVSQGVELVLAVVLLGGVLVLAATVSASMSVRMHEASILRALGSGRRLIVGGLWLEFSLLGFLAGTMAVVATEALLVSLRLWVFEQEAVLHPQIWLPAPVLAGLIIGIMGAFACRKTVTVPPAQVLREVT